MGYHGPPPLTWARVFTAWTFDPVIVALVAVLAAGYLLGIARLRRRGEEWPASRTIWFALGLAFWLIGCCSAMGVYERVLFTDRAVQLVVLLMIVPLFLAMGMPISLLVESGDHERLRRALRGKVSRILQFPPVASLFLIAPPWIVYFTPLYEASMRHEGVNLTLHVVLVVLGIGYFWPRLQVDPVSREYPYLISVGIAFGEVVFDGALGLLLIYGPLIAPHYYLGLHRPWGDSVKGDQTWGGASFWVVGDAAGLPFLGALLYRMLHKDREQQVEIDAELDAQAEAERALDAAERVISGEPEPTGDGPEMMRPWWETDPAFARRYGRGTAG